MSEHAERGVGCSGHSKNSFIGTFFQVIVSNLLRQKYFLVPNKSKPPPPPPPTNPIIKDHCFIVKCGFGSNSLPYHQRKKKQKGVWLFDQLLISFQRDLHEVYTCPLTWRRCFCARVWRTQIPPTGLSFHELFSEMGPEYLS